MLHVPIWVRPGSNLQRLVDELEGCEEVQKRLAGIINTVKDTTEVQGTLYRGLYLKKSITTDDAFLDIGVYGGLLTTDAGREYSAYQMPVLQENKDELCIDSEELARPTPLPDFEELSACAIALGGAHLVNHRCSGSCAVFNSWFFPPIQLPLVVLSIKQHKSLNDGDEITVNYGPEYVKTRKQWLTLYEQQNPGASEEDKTAYFATLEVCQCVPCMQNQANVQKEADLYYKNKHFDDRRCMQKHKVFDAE